MRRALQWLARELRLPAAPSSLDALTQAQLLLVAEACTRPLGLRWELCASCGQPVLPSVTAQQQVQTLARLGAELEAVWCASCGPPPLS